MVWGGGLEAFPCAFPGDLLKAKGLHSIEDCHQISWFFCCCSSIMAGNIYTCMPVWLLWGGWGLLPAPYPIFISFHFLPPTPLSFCNFSIGLSRMITYLKGWALHPPTSFSVPLMLCDYCKIFYRVYQVWIRVTSYKSGSCVEMEYMSKQPCKWCFCSMQTDLGKFA